MKKKKVTIDDVMAAALARMAELDPSSPEYKKIAENLQILRDAASKPNANKVCKDTIWKVSGYVGLGVMMLAFERCNPITSKLLQKINFWKPM